MNTILVHWLYSYIVIIVIMKYSYRIPLRLWFILHLINYYNWQQKLKYISIHICYNVINVGKSSMQSVWINVLNGRLQERKRRRINVTQEIQLGSILFTKNDIK